MKEFTTTDGVEYSIDQYGVIHQLNAKPFVYDKEYINTYNTPAYTQASKELNQIRFSLLVGQYGKMPNQILDYGYGNGDFLETACLNVDFCHLYSFALQFKNTKTFYLFFS